MTIDIAQILTIGGPTSIISVLIYVLINAYVSARRERREDRTASVSTDSGILENAKKVLELVRNETERIERQNIELLARAETEEKRRRHLEETVAQHERTIDFLTRDLREAKALIDELRGQYGHA